MSTKKCGAQSADWADDVSRAQGETPGRARAGAGNWRGARRAPRGARLEAQNKPPNPGPRSVCALHTVHTAHMCTKSNVSE
jgi:hypothetical protein